MKTKALVQTLTVAILSSLIACTNNKTAERSVFERSPRAASPSAIASPDLNNTHKGTTINVTAKETGFALSPATAKAGLVEFVIKNESKEPQELVVLKNDRLDQQLPLKGENLDEEATGLKNLGEVDQSKLQSGTTQTLKLNLKPGRYLLVSNLPGHVQAGMKTELIVK